MSDSHTSNQSTTSEDVAGIHVVNSQFAIPKATTREPLASGFIHIGAEIDRILPFGFRRPSRNKREATALAVSFADRLERLDGVVRADVFVAQLIPPGAGSLEGHSRSHRARFDLAILVETTDPEAAAEVQRHDLHRRLLMALRERSRYLHVMRARNLVNLGRVDTSRDGLFLFNYFHADDRAKMAPVFERTAGWFETYTKLHNSTLLGADDAEDSRYVVNHCRWDRWRDVIPQLRLRNTFRTYVLANFHANDIVPMPILYRVVRRPDRAERKTT